MNTPINYGRLQLAKWLHQTRWITPERLKEEALVLLKERKELAGSTVEIFDNQEDAQRSTNNFIYRILWNHVDPPEISRIQNGQEVQPRPYTWYIASNREIPAILTTEDAPSTILRKILSSFPPPHARIPLSENAVKAFASRLIPRDSLELIVEQYGRVSDYLPLTSRRENIPLREMLSVVLEHEQLPILKVSRGTDLSKFSTREFISPQLAGEIEYRYLRYAEYLRGLSLPKEKLVSIVTALKEKIPILGFWVAYSPETKKVSIGFNDIFSDQLHSKKLGSQEAPCEISASDVEKIMQVKEYIDNLVEPDDQMRDRIRSQVKALFDIARRRPNFLHCIGIIFPDSIMRNEKNFIAFPYNSVFPKNTLDTIEALIERIETNRSRKPYEFMSDELMAASVYPPAHDQVRRIFSREQSEKEKTVRYAVIDKNKPAPSSSVMKETYYDIMDSVKKGVLYKMGIHNLVLDAGKSWKWLKEGNLWVFCADCKRIEEYNKANSTSYALVIKKEKKE